MAKISLRSYCPDGRAQIWGTCYAYAPVYVARTASFCIAQGISDSGEVEANAFSDAFVASIVSPKGIFNEHCSRNGTADKSLEVLKNIGVRRIVDYGEALARHPNEAGAELYRIADFSVRETRRSDSDQSDLAEVIAEIKALLSKKKVVICAIEQPESLFHNRRAQWLPRPGEILSRRYANHCLCLVGFDEGSEIGDAFEIRNNYSDWGDGRYAMGRSADFVKCVETFYSIDE